MTTSELRYQLPKKAIKTDCPDCGPKHRRTLSRFVDTRTDELLPDQFGRCDRESNCGYFLSPYTKGPSGLSYADQVYEQHKANRTMTYQPSIPAPRPQPIAPVYSIPDEVFNLSIGHYERNQLASLLQDHFGIGVAGELLQRFQIGTSSRWPGACVFWYIDEKGRKLGGQIKRFGPDWHTEKYIDREGKTRSKTSWVHFALTYRLKKAGTPVPDWLTDYNQKAQYSACLFGLPQLRTDSTDKPVAIVEAPKTAILCTPYFSEFIWLAIGSLSYFTANTEAGLNRMAAIKNRKIVLFPDLSTDGSTYNKWSRSAEDFRTKGYQILVSDYLEQLATDQARAEGLDLADYLLDGWKGYPPDWDRSIVNIEK